MYYSLEVTCTTLDTAYMN